MELFPVSVNSDSLRITNAGQIPVSVAVVLKPVAPLASASLMAPKRQY